MTQPSRSNDEHDAGALHLRDGDMLAFDHYRGAVRVIPSQDWAAQAALALPRAQQAARDFSAEAESLRAVLCELHRAVTEDDGSDADEARLQDALSNARLLAPYEPDEPSGSGPFGF